MTAEPTGGPTDTPRGTDGIEAQDGPFRVGDWNVDPPLRLLRPAHGDAEEVVDDEVRIGHKPLVLLQLLASRPGEVFSKEDLVDAVWDGAATTDDAVMAVVYELRKALGDDARAPRYVETIRQRGYRLIASVEPATRTPPADEIDDANDTASPDPGPGHEEDGSQQFSGRRQRFTIVAVLVLAAITGAVWLLGPISSDDPVPQAQRPAAEGVATAEVRSLAIRPLAVFGESSAEACRENAETDSLTELLIASLAGGAPLEILGAGDDSAWSTEATADAVVEGSVIRSGPRLWVNIRLVESRSGQLLWGASYEREGVDVFLVERALADEIAAQVLSKVSTVEPSEGA